MNYLLIGPEEYLKSQFLEKLKKSILDKNSGAFDFEVFHAGSSKISTISDSLNTLPFGSKNRLTVIKDIDKFSAQEKNSILKYIKSPRRSTTLVLESLSGRFSDKSMQEISRYAKLIRCTGLKEGEIGSWIKGEFSARKKRISISLADLIKELVGKDMFLLKNEIEKIVSFAGDADEITEPHVEAVLGKAPYRTAFELVDLILEKRIGRILAFMESFLSKEKPHRILNVLAWQFRSFIKIKDLPKGLSADGISRALNIKRAFAGKVIEQGKRFTRSELEKNLRVILEADFFIKRGVLDPQHALERVLVRLAG